MSIALELNNLVEVVGIRYIKNAVVFARSVQKAHWNIARRLYLEARK